MRWGLCRLLLTGGLSAGVAASAFAQVAGDAGPQLTEIRTKLISDDFSVREQGRAQLAKIPPSAIETLRASEKTETDEEVRARLRSRIAEMELYAIVHPPGLSLEKNVYSLAEVAASLNKQLGTEALMVSGDNRGFPMSADNLPFWEILRQYNAFQPVSVSSSLINNPDGSSTNRFRLTQLNLNTNPQFLSVSDTFAILAPSRAQSITDGWSIRPTIFCDPRVKISQYSTSIRVDQITSQNGESLLNSVTPGGTAMSNPTRPVASFMATVTLRGVSNLTRIKEIRGRVTMMVVESERTVSFDLTKDKQEPVKMSVGTFSLRTDAAGNQTLVLDAKNADGTPVASASLPILSIRFLTKEGRAVRSVATRSTSVLLTQLINAGAGLAAGGGDVTSIEFSMVDKAREFVLPIVLKDIDLPALLPAAPDQLRLDPFLP